MAPPKHCKVCSFVCSNNIKSLVVYVVGVGDTVVKRKKLSLCPDQRENLLETKLQASRTAILHVL